jgi:hypothetical protein
LRALVDINDDYTIGPAALKFSVVAFDVNFLMIGNMSNRLSSYMIKGPILRIDTMLRVENAIVDVEMVIVCVEQYLNRFALMARDKVEVDAPG